MSDIDKQIDVFARAWVKYISVATLQGENALTRKGVEDAIKGYKSVTEDFSSSLQALISTAVREADRASLETISAILSGTSKNTDHKRVVEIAQSYIHNKLEMYELKEEQ